MNKTNLSRNNNRSVRLLTYSALFLAIALVLPFLTGQIPQIGSMLSPMHIPVFLCGFTCGWSCGMIVGLLAPILRSVLFGMPVMFPAAIAMAFELAVYGIVSGLLYSMLPKKGWAIYVSLIAAMLAGRVVWGLVRLVLAGVAGTQFTVAMFMAGAFTNAVPGIILHLCLIPPVVLALNRAGLVLNHD